MLQGIDSIAQFLNFNGNAEDLIAASARLANELRLLPDGEHTPRADEISSSAPPEESEPQDTGNERLLRHYVSMKVVDRPTRQGRDAIYGYRHLLQFLTARRLLLRGFGLAKIAQYTSVVPTQSLADALISPPHRSEAELLVTAYKTSDQRDLEAAENTIKRSVATKMKPRPTARTTPLFSAPLAPDAMYGMADLVHEVDKLRYRFREEMEEIQESFQDSLTELQKTLDQVRQENPDQASLELSWREPSRNLHVELIQGVNALSESIAKNDQTLRHLMESQLEMLQHKLEQNTYGLKQHFDSTQQKLLIETGRNREQIEALAHAIEFHAELLEKIATTTAQSRSGDLS